MIFSAENNVTLIKQRKTQCFGETINFLRKYVAISDEQNKEKVLVRRYIYSIDAKLRMKFVPIWVFPMSMKKVPEIIYLVEHLPRQQSFSIYSINKNTYKKLS